MTSYHVEHIKAYLKSQGFTDQELIDDLTDHLATEIEFSMDSEKLDFATSFEKAKQKLLPDSPYQLERDLKILTTPMHNIMIKKIGYLGGFLSMACFALAIMFYSLTTIKQKKSSLIQQAAQAEYFTETGRNMSDGLGEHWYASSQHKAYEKSVMNNVLLTSKWLTWSERLFIMSFILFISTFLPFQFYNRYLKSQLELTA